MPHCAFHQCTNHTKKKNKAQGVTFHSFPDDPITKHKWLFVVRQQRREPDYLSNKHSRVCSMHFKPEDMYTTVKGLRRIVKGAVPYFRDAMKSSKYNGKSGTSQHYSLKRNLGRGKASKKKSSRENTKPSRKSKKVTVHFKTLKEAIVTLKKKINIPGDTFAELYKKAAAADLFNRIGSQKKSNKYIRMWFSPNVRKFALALHLYSPAGYKYVRTHFDGALPHTRELDKWYENKDASPGFTSEAFRTLRQKHNVAGKKLLCTLLIDEMAIRQNTIWNGKQTIGLVDYGIGNKETDSIASEAFVMMLVSLDDDWKLPIGHFFVNGLTAKLKANIINICLAKCWEVGANVVALTFDASKINIDAANELGCQLSDVEKLKTTFKHPSCDTTVAVFLDPCCMMELVKNTFQSKKVLLDNDGRTIKWQFIANLMKLQGSQTLSFEDNLTTKYIDFRNLITKVNIQLLSLNVAKSLKLSEQLLLSTRFVNTDATVNFIENINNILDIMSSRKTICPENKDKVFNFLDKIKEYICTLQIFVKFRRNFKDSVSEIVSKTKLVQSTQSIGFVGFVVSIESLKHLYSTLVAKKRMRYIVPHRLNKSHLDLFFETIRREGNSHPNVLEFRSVYRKILGHLNLRLLSGNSAALDNFPTINCSSGVGNINGTAMRVCNVNTKIFPSHPSDLTATSNVIILNDLLINNLQHISASQVIGYIAGWVAKILIKAIKCETCATELMTNRKLHFHKLIAIEDMGGLCYPANGLYKICVQSERELKRFIEMHKTEQFVSEKQIMRLKLDIMETFINSDMLSSLHAHSMNQPATFNHRIQLMKAIVEEYCNVRMQYFQQIPSSLTAKRQFSHKLSLF